MVDVYLWTGGDDDEAEEAAMLTKLDVMMGSPGVGVAMPSALEKMLVDKKRMDMIRQKYNLRDTKNQKVPEMQWEGDDHS